MTLGAPFDPGHVSHHFDAALPEIEAKGRAEVCLGGRPFVIGKEFVDDIHAEALAPAIAELKAALLVLHAPRDETVSIDNAASIFTAAKHPKSFVTLDDADHLISRAADAEYAAEVIAAWAGRYVKMTPPAPPPGAPEGILRVTEADPEGFLQDVQSGPYHHAFADEPLAYGGTNRGMSPYGFVAAGLGACTSMTLRMYARRKGWPLEGISVDVSHDKVHAQDALPSGPAKIDQFTRVVRLCGPLERRTARAAAGNRRQMPGAPDAGKRRQGGDAAGGNGAGLRSDTLAISGGAPAPGRCRQPAPAAALGPAPRTVRGAGPNCGRPSQKAAAQAGDPDCCGICATSKSGPRSRPCCVHSRRRPGMGGETWDFLQNSGAAAIWCRAWPAVLGIDYGEMVAADPQAQGQKYMRAVLRCSTCRNQDGCSDLQRETTELAEAPSYCRNAQLLAHLRGS